MFFNKRGQFYIIISVILAIAVFSITSDPNRIQEAILFESFESLSNNYIHEAGYVVNYALEQREDVGVKLDEFTQRYLDYSEQRNPNLNLLYVYSDPETEEVKLVNYFNEPVILGEIEIPGYDQEVIQDVSIEVAGSDFSHKVPVKVGDFGSDWYTDDVPYDFNLGVAGFLHNFDLSESGPTFRVIVNLESGEQYISENLGGDEEDPFESPPAESENLKYVVRQVKVS